MTTPKRIQKIYALLGIALLCLVATCFLPRIAQPVDYHNFADSRTIWGIPFFWDVVSNLPFLMIGIAGLMRLRDIKTDYRLFFGMLFFGIFFTGIGSGYYHWMPNNTRLIWDRLPMTVVFMSFFSLLLAVHISIEAGRRFLVPLLLLGAASIGWWWFSEEIQQNGDLRPYLLVQFLPMLLLPLLVVLFPSRVFSTRHLVWILGWYVLAKVFEAKDDYLYTQLDFSGHALKHLAASVAVWGMWKMSLEARL
ncbi:MAG: ceramidase domain-containing protein [Bacteroidia bacterium]